MSARRDPHAGLTYRVRAPVTWPPVYAFECVGYERTAGPTAALPSIARYTFADGAVVTTTFAPGEHTRAALERGELVVTLRSNRPLVVDPAAGVVRVIAPARLALVGGTS